MQEENNYFDQVVFTAEQEYTQNPKQFWRNMYGYTGLGYIAIFSLSVSFDFACAVIGITIGLMAKDAMDLFSELIGYGFAFALLYTILLPNPFRKYNPAKGYELSKQSCPVLFDELAQLREKQPAPCLHKILLTYEQSSSLSIRPYFTYLGFHQYTLSLSMEDFLIMSPDEMRSVLAHEWGHLVSKRGRLGSRISLIIALLKVFTHLFEKYHLNKLHLHLQHLIVKLVAYSNVVARQDEYTADAVAAKLTSSKDISNCLSTCHIVGHWLSNQYWQPLYELYRFLPKPDLTPFTTLRSFLVGYSFAQNELFPIAKQILATKDNPYFTHPTLSQRLSALNSEPVHSADFSETSAESWLGNQLDNLLAIVDKQWQQHYVVVWGQCHERNQIKQNIEVAPDTSSIETYVCDKS